MKLLYQTHSPYARKALENPLGKVPVLLRPNLPPIFDSNVICKYLDTLHAGTPLIPAQGEARWQALRIQAVAPGLADVGIAVRWENTRRPEALHYPKLSCCLSQKLVESFDWLEKELDVQGPVHVGHIALATALSWLEFRDILLCDFREGRPRLAAWYEAFDAGNTVVGGDPRLTCIDRSCNVLIGSSVHQSALYKFCARAIVISNTFRRLRS
ncbi:hypothetical protein MferCBS31731_007708 [Microsporum ferrugineum]